MEIKQYKIGEIVIEISSPIEIEDIKPFSDFLVNNEEADYKVNFKLVDDLPQNIGHIDVTERDFDFVREDNENRFYYKNEDTDEYYGCRITKDGELSCTVEIAEKFKSMIWTRIVFGIIGLEEILAQFGRVIFHSSFINVDGKAMLFTGPCEIGKSTQADLWAKYRNVEIVNGDKSLIFEKDGVVMAGGLPYSGSSCYCLNKNLPLKAIVKLEKAKYNRTVKQESIFAFLNVYKSIYPIVYSKELTSKLMDLAELFCSKVSVYNFECLPDESAVICLEESLNG